MGLRPKDAPPSYNELLWWSAWRSYIPTLRDRIDNLQYCFAGSKVNYFNPIYDKDLEEELMPSQEEIDKTKAAYEKEKAERAREENVSNS